MSRYEQRRRLGIPGSLSPALTGSRFLMASFPIPVQQHELLKARFQHSRDCGFQGDFADWILQCVLIGSQEIRNFSEVRK